VGAVAREVAHDWAAGVRGAARMGGAGSESESESECESGRECGRESESGRESGRESRAALRGWHRRRWYA
jgi:hypothetical protein